jgi:hypothetical protein
MQKKQKKVKFTTQQGRAQYPWLNEPDVAFGNEPKYKTNLIVQDASGLVSQIEKIAEEQFGSDWSKARLPFKTDEDTGETVFITKSKYVPHFFDSSGQNLVGAQVPTLWGGSVLKVGGYIAPYTVSGQSGISLQLTRVQVIDPVSSSNGDGGSNGEGFEAVSEGGFIGEDVITQETFDATEEEDPETAQVAASADRF